MNRYRAICAGLTPLVALSPAVSGAAQWQWLPTFALAADADSNRRLRAEERPSESGTLGATLAVVRATEISQLAFLPRVSLARYSGEDALDSDDYGADAYWRRSGERTSVDLRAGWSDDSTLTTELGETGLVEGNTRRRLTSASASFTQFLGLRHLLQGQLSASDIDYQQTQGTGLVGYRYPAASLQYAYTLSPRFDATLSANRARLDAPEVNLRSDTTGAQLGFRFRVTERLNFELRAGESRTEARGRQDRERSFSSSLSWAGELSDFEVSLSREVQPSGRGVLVNADDLRLSWSRDMGERWKLNGALRVSRRDDSLLTISNDYYFGAALLGLSRQLDENWTLGLAAGYSRQDYELAAQAADAQRFGISLSWRPLQ
jgi:hypothetical protein